MELLKALRPNISSAIITLLGVIGLCFVFFIPVALNGQDDFKIDSLNQELSAAQNNLEKIKILNLLSVEYLNVNSEKGIRFAENALELSLESGSLKDMAKSREMLGEHYLNLQKYAVALDNFERAAKNYESISDVQSYWEMIRFTGQIYYETGDFTKALNNFFDVLKFYEKQDNSEKIAMTLNNIGILYHRQLNPEKAIEYYNQALKILNENGMGEDEMNARLQTNLGLSYLALEEYKKAEECYLRSLELNEKIGNQRIQTVNIGNLAGVYAEIGAYEKSEEYFLMAIEDSKKANNIHSEAINYGDIGILYLDMAEDNYQNKKDHYLDLAMYYFQKSLGILLQFNDLRNYQWFSEFLSKSYELKGDYREALSVYKTHIAYKDSVFNQEINKEFTTKELEHAFSKREDSIRIQNERDIAIKDAMIKVNKTQKSMLFGGMLLLSIIGAMLFYQNQTRKKNNEKLSLLNEELNQANQIKARFFSILTHDLRSPISNVVKFIKFKQNHVIELDEQTKKRLERETVDSAENLLKSMEDLLLWSKGQLENFQPEISAVNIEDIFKEYCQFYRYQTQIEIDFRSEKDLIIQTDPDYLKTIIRNLTSNALKAMKNSRNPKVEWRAFKEGDKRILKINDNGPGAYPEQFRALFDETHTIGIQTGLGLHLVRDMAEAIHCKLEVNTAPDKGTEITLVFD